MRSFVRLALVSFLLLFSMASNAAPPTLAWAVTTSTTPTLALDQNGFNIADVGPRSATDSSGNLIVAASSIGSTSGTSCAVVLKYSAADGSIAWRRDICPGFTGSLAVDSAGDVLMAGASSTSALVTKLSGADGTTLWQQLLAPSSGTNHAAAGMSIGVDAANDARVAVYDNGGIVTVYAFQGTDGTVQWLRDLPDTLGTDKIQAFAVAGNGESVLADFLTDGNNQTQSRTTLLDSFGSIAWQAASGASHLGFDAAGNVIASAGSSTVKRDAATGSALWTQSIGGDFALDAAGNIYISTQAGPPSDSDIVAAKIAPDGTLVWQNTLTDSTYNGIGGSVAIDADGNPVVAAEASASGGQAKQPTIKYSANDGHILWIGTDADANVANFPREIRAGSQGILELGAAFQQGTSTELGLRVLKYLDAPDSSSKAAAAVSIASSANPSIAGQSVSFTASVSGSGTPGGTVDFLDGITIIPGCASVALVGNSATCSTSSLVAGNHAILATYSGDANFNSDSSTVLAQTVNSTKADPSMSLSGTPNPKLPSDTAVLTASVSGGNGAPTGTVDFLDGTAAIPGCQGVQLAAGSSSTASASCAFSSSTTGDHTISAQYSGSFAYNGATASFVEAVRNPPPSTVSFTSSQNPSTQGQSVSFSWTLSGNGGTPAPTGTVDFLDGSTVIAGCSAVPLSGSAATCTTSALAAGTHSISARYSGDANYGTTTTPPQLTIMQTVQAAGQFTLAVSKGGSGAGTITSSPVGIDCGATCSASFDAGTTVSLSAAASSGSSFAGWSGGGCSGTGTCTVTMSAARSVTATFDAVTSANPVRLGNISTRGDVLTGEDVLIGGFIIGGSANKTVAIVATGPSLAAFGIANPLMNPAIQLVRQSDHAVIATNDDWQSDANAAQLQASGFAPPDSREAGLYVNLPPGAYTVIVSGVGGTTGVSVIGVFEIDHPEAPIVNISTRGLVQTGDNVMIGGFIINGSAPQTVAITATGPSLSAFGISNPLANPTLTIVRQSDHAVIATNDDWQSDANAAQLQAKGFAPSDPHEAGLLLTLPPGAYTAIVSGVGNTTGVSVVGVFNAQ